MRGGLVEDYVGRQLCRCLVCGDGCTGVLPEARVSCRFLHVCSVAKEEVTVLEVAGLGACKAGHKHDARFMTIQHELENCACASPVRRRISFLANGRQVSNSKHHDPQPPPTSPTGGTSCLLVVLAMCPQCLRDAGPNARTVGLMSFSISPLRPAIQ
jgi:hypothetical protein